MAAWLLFRIRDGWLELRGWGMLLLDGSDRRIPLFWGSGVRNWRQSVTASPSNFGLYVKVGQSEIAMYSKRLEFQPPKMNLTWQLYFPVGTRAHALAYSLALSHWA